MHISIVISLFSFYFILQVFLEQPVTKLRSSVSEIWIVSRRYRWFQTLRSLPEYSCLSFLVVPTLSEQSLSTWLNMQAFNFLVVVPNFLMFWLAILMVYTTAKFLSLLKKEAQISTFFMNFHKLYLRSLIIQMVESFVKWICVEAFIGRPLYHCRDPRTLLFCGSHLQYWSFRYSEGSR